MERQLHTLRKEKLPKGFGYPTSSSMLSTALSDVPQFDEIELSFNWRTFGATAWNNAIKNKLEIDGLRAYYSPRFGWSLRVFAVPSEQCAAARESLTATALPALRGQLNAWVDDRNYFTWSAKFSLASSEYCCHIGW
jgi:hypothetical protein